MASVRISQYGEWSVYGVNFKPMVIIEDESHAESQGEFADFPGAVAELRRRAKIPWDQEPNLAPCGSWRTCGRRYQLVEIDGAGPFGKELRREMVLEVSASGVYWIGGYRSDGEWPEYRKLESADRFSIGSVGFAGGVSGEENAFRVVMKSEKAADSFLALLLSATPEGRMYALIGLKLLKAPEFEKCCAGFEVRDTPVKTVESCIVEDKAMGAVARAIRRGKYG